MGERVYLGSCAGMMYAIDATTGDVDWQYNVNPDSASQFHGNLVYENDVLLVGTDQGTRMLRGTLYAIDQ